MSDLENGDESLLSDDNNNINLHFMEDIENSYKIYINQLIDIIANILDKLTIKNSLEEDDSNEDENGEIILLKTKTKLTCMNSYKLFYTCFVLSMKFNEDRHNSNKFYAKVCGVNINDFLLMEYRALKYLDFSLFIQTETYEMYYNNIYSV